MSCWLIPKCGAVSVQVVRNSQAQSDPKLPVLRIYPHFCHLKKAYVMIVMLTR